MIDPISSHLFRNSGTHGPITLMYHSIYKVKNNWPWGVSLNNFRRQLDLIKSNGWTTATIRDITALNYKQTQPTIVITFDDGYVDNNYAFEELDKRGMTASFFVVSGYIGQTPKWETDDRPKDRLLNSSELKSMTLAGMEIGAHGINHLRLTELNDLVLNQEVSLSKSEIEATLDSPITSFAYPYGAWNEKCKQAVVNAGYKAACTTGSGWTMLDMDYFSLRRLTIYNNDSLSVFARKVALADNNVSWSKIRKYYINRLYQKYASVK